MSLASLFAAVGLMYCRFSRGTFHYMSIAISGMKRDGERFTCCVQFDAAQRQVVTCHPTWFKEAQKAGLDMKYSKEVKVDKEVKQQVENTMKQGQRKGRNQTLKMG